MRVFPFTAFQFYFYELFKSLLFPKGEQNNYTVKLTAGGLAGIATSTLTYPLDLIRTFLAIQTTHHRTDVFGSKPSITRGLVNIVKKRGFSGLYAGWPVTVLSVVPYIGLQMSVFDWTATYFSPDKTSPWFDLINLAVGGWAGFLSAGLTYPSDVLRRKMQISVRLHRKDRE